MAKKVVATLKTGSGKDFAKIYRAVKNKKGDQWSPSILCPITYLGSTTDGLTFP